MPPSSRPGPSRQCGRPPLSADTMGFPRHVSLQSAVRTSQPGRPREGARLRGPGQEGAGTGRPMPSRERARPCPCEKHFLPKPQPQNCSHGHRGRAGAWSPPCAARGPDPRRGNSWKPVRTRPMRQEGNSETGPPSLAPAPHGCQVTSRVFTRHALLRLIFTPENTSRACRPRCALVWDGWPSRRCTGCSRRQRARTPVFCDGAP